MTQTRIETYRDENTRPIVMPDGSEWEVRMTPDLWESLEFLKEVEGVSAALAERIYGHFNSG